MRYGVKQMVVEDYLMDRISIAQGNKIDWEERTTVMLFNGLLDKIKETLKDVVEFKQNYDNDTVEASLDLVVYGDKEFRDKIRKLKSIMNANNISGNAQMDILNIFKTDSIETHRNNGRVYI